MSPDRSLLVTTLDPLPGWPRVHQLAASTARGSAYRFFLRERREQLAVVQLGLAGRGRVWTGGREQTVDPGQALLMRSGIDDLSYGLAPGDPPWRFVYAELAGAQALDALGALIAARGHVVTADAQELERLIGGLADRAGARHALWEAGASARTAMAVLAAVAAPPRGEADLVRRAIAWFEPRLDQRLAVADAARALGVGREHLSRAMRQALGEPPAAWLRRRRLELARHLLAAPEARVAAVAAQVGYRSTAQFVRAFTAHFACTPGRLHRRSGRGIAGM